MLDDRPIRAHEPARSRVRRFGVLVGLALGMFVAGSLARSTATVPGTTTELRAWMTTTDLGAALVPVCVVVLAAVASVVTFAAMLYGGLRICGCARAAAAVGAVVLPRVRRRIDRFLAVTLVATTLTSGATARAALADDVVVREPEPAPAVVDDGEAVDAVSDAEIVRDEAGPPPVTGPAPANDSGPDASAAVRATDDVAPPPAAMPPGPDRAPVAAPSTPSGLNPTVSQPVGPPSAERQYTVETGDNLWTIAATRLASARRVAVHDLADGDVATYWVRVVEANRATIRSGNPNRIYAGEVIVLPSP